MNVPVQGAELYVSVRGEGSVCLVLSAIGTKPYERMMPALLDERLRLAFVDLRGGGLSTGNAAELTFDVLAQDLDAVRAALGVERVAVLGHSILGALAIEAARRLPERVSHAIAVSTPPWWDFTRLAAAGDEFFARDASAERKEILRENLAKLPPGATQSQAMYAQTPRRFFDPRFDAAPLFAESVVRPELLMHVMGTLTAGWDVLAGKPPLAVPLCIALGRYDYVVPHALWDDVAPRLADTTVIRFERSGHQAFCEEPERFADELVAWMNRGAAARH